MPFSGADPARALGTLQRLLEIPAANLGAALTHASNVMAQALDADKVDAYMYDKMRDSLVAMGTSTQLLSSHQKKLGLDVLPISNGGRVVYVYKTGTVYRTGRLQEDMEELKGIREGLKIHSKLGIPLFIGSRLRGMVMIASLKPDHFTEGDEAFARSATNWLGMVAHRAELIEDIERNALEQGRRAAAEELVTELAHDLRNYISPIASRLYVLRHRAEEHADGEALEHIGAALRGVSALTGMITSLLDVSRIDRGAFELDLEPVDLASLARKSAAVLATAEHEILIRASEAVLVRGDAARLRQCLDNLLANALLHSPKGAPVNVFIRAIDDGEPLGQLEVVDEGPGIPQEIL